MENTAVMKLLDGAFAKNKDEIKAEYKVDLDTVKDEIATTFNALLAEKIAEIEKASDEKLEKMKATSKGGFGSTENLNAKYLTVDKDANGIVIRHTYAYGKMIRDRQFAPAVLPRGNASTVGKEVSVIDSFAPLFHMDLLGSWATQIQSATHNAKRNLFGNLTVTEADVNVPVTGQKNSVGYAPTAGNIIVIPTFELLAAVAKEALQDIPDLMGQLLDAIMRAFELHKAGQTLVNIKAGATKHVIKTGVDDGLPTITNIIGLIEDMITSITYEYQNDFRLVVSRKVKSLMRRGAVNAGFDFNAALGLNMYDDIPIYVTTQMEEGTADGQVVAAIGNFPRALRNYTAENFTLEDDGYRHGATQWYARYGSIIDVFDTDAIAVMTVGE